jgi:hypothetical protein
MQMKQITNGRVPATFGAVIKSMILLQTWVGLAFCGLLLLAYVTPAAAQSQTVLISASPSRITVPFNFSGTNTTLVNLSIANGTNEVDLNLSGLPTGAMATLSKTVFTNGSATSTLTFFLTNVTEGIYWLTLSATNNATNFLNFPLQVGNIWSGAGANKNWSTTGNWNGGVVPGVNDDVIFNQGGAQTTTNTNSIVDITTTIASLRFALTNSSTNFQTILINPGVTLNITGTNSLSELRDMINLAQSMNVIIAGQGGTLNVANESGTFAMLNDANVKSLLDMQKLGLFTADVNRLGIGDLNAYPNYTNLQANNNNSGVPKRYLPTLNLAMTNIIKAVYVDPYNYTNSTNRAYALELGNNGNQATSSSAQLLISMGVSNLFLMDGFCITGNGGTIGTINFNTNDASINPNPTAYFRNTDGVSRMSMFAIADAATYFTNVTGNTKANSFNGVDFADGKGSVNALVDRFIMSRDAPISINGGCTAQSQMELGQGIFDVNTAILGDQTGGDQPQINYAQATLTVSNTAVFRANVDLEIGWTTSDINDPSLPGDTWGVLNVGPGGTVMANQIGVGGPTKNSGLVGSSDANGKANQINLSNGSLLIVSNTIADATPNGALGILNMTGNGTLELFIDGSINRTNVYVKTLTTTGSGNTIKIGAINNLTVPAQVPLIAYASGTPTFNLSLPSGYSGAIINNGPGKTIDAFIVSGAPKILVWRGYQSATWNTTDNNWLDLNTGLHTNFANLDNVSFDDTASIPTTISLSGLLIPGAVGITNSINSYIFNGSGSTSGSATLTKTGTASLEIDASTTLSVVLNQGTLTGSGTINSITSAAGTTVLYAGTVNAGLICSGTATSSGTLSGGIDIKNGGIFTNLNTVNGPITLETGSFVNNEATIQNMFPSGSVATNAFLLNSGFINDGGAPAADNGTLTINFGGTFEDTGAGSMTLFRLTLASGCTFIPGGGGLGTTVINSDGAATFPGRLSMANGSRTLLYVNGSSYTKLQSGCVDYGPSQSSQSQNGCTLIITNLGAPYTAGQVFQFFGNAFNGGNPLPDGTSTNSFPLIVPPIPGPGLAWDLSHLWPGGNIGVIVPPIVTLTNSITRISTNIVSSFTWSANQAGWVLETQTRPITNGLSLNNADWTRISGSNTNLSATITNNVMSGTNAVFYRLVFP